MSDTVGKKAVKAGIGYTIGNILVRGVVFLSLPIFTRLMSTEDFGLYTTYISYESIIALFLGLGLHASFKAAKVEFKDKINEYTSALLTFTLLFNTPILCVIFVFRNQIGMFLGFTGTIVVLMFLQALATAIFSMYNSRVGLEYLYKQYLLLAFINSFCNIAFSLVFMLTIYRQTPFMGRVSGTILAMIIVALIPTCIFYAKARPILQKDYLSFGLKYSIPLIPHGLSQLILAQFGKIVIQKQVGNSEAGIYGFTYSIVAVLQIVANSMDAAWGPWFFDTYTKGDVPEIKKRTTQYVALFATITGILFCISPELVKVMAGQEYWSAVSLICPALLGVFFSFIYTLPVQLEYYYKKTKFIAVGTVIAAVLHVILCIVCIPQFGYESVVYVTVFTYMLYFFTHLLIARYITRMSLPYDLKALWGYIVVICILCAGIQMCLEQWMIRYTLVIIWCTIMLMRNREFIKDILKSRMERK